MLKKYDVNLQRLLHNNPVSNIEIQIKDCSDCVQISECDRVLSKSVVSDHELRFCPNYATILQNNDSFE